MRKIILFTAGLVLLLFLIFHYSGHHPLEISDVNASLRHQFEKQWAEKKDPGDTRFIKDVQINRFYSPNGNNEYDAEIMVLWNTTREYASSPLVRLGTSASAISIEVPDTKQQLSAIIMTK